MDKDVLLSNQYPLLDQLEKIQENRQTVQYSLPSTDISHTTSPLIKEQLKRTIHTKRTIQGLPKLTTDSITRQVCEVMNQGNDDGQKETDIKRVRRERNRLAAAKSRYKRKEQSEHLSTEVAKLEEGNFKLRDEIRKLDREKNRLSLMLGVHELKCPIRGTPLTRQESWGSA
ncbi:cyclic AMP-dependent transcription factor ATF-3-like [Glandiceps talaboti]